MGNLHVNPKSKLLAVSQLITDYFLLLTRMGVIFLDELSCDYWPGLHIIPPRNENFMQMAVLTPPSHWEKQPTKIKNHV